MSSKILITGATGFVGAHLLENLVNLDINVRCFVRSSSTLSVNNERVEIFEGDLLNPSDCYEALNGIDIVYHIAGLGLSRIKENPTFNEVSTRTLLDSAERHDKQITIIYLSSIKAVGPNQLERISEVTSFSPTDLYGISKAKAEKEILNFKSTKVRTIIVRPPAVYGPGDKNFLPIFNLMHKGIQINFVGKSLNNFTMVHVSDLVDALIKIPYKVKESEILNISHKDVIDWNQFFQHTLVISNKKKIKKVFLPKSTTYYSLKAIANLLKIFNKSYILPISRVNDLLLYNWSVNTTKSELRYGLKCKISLKEGLIETYNWYLKNGWFDKKEI